LPRGAARSNHRRYIFGELGEGTNIRYMVRSRDFKYIVHPAQGAEELYDLAADPNELSNLLENPRDSHGVIRELRGELKRWIASADGHVHPLVPSMWPEE
jgi:arylsulfatase A-like enzyme